MACFSALQTLLTRMRLTTVQTLIFSLLLALTSVFSPALRADPVGWQRADEQWLTQTSDHFEIHFLAGYDAMAARALAIAEQVHEELVPFFTQAPAQRTHLVLSDDFDLSNGWATPLPYNQIRLFASPPEDVSGLEHMDDWLHGLIRHEYVHTLQMDMRSGVTATGSRIFGRFYLFFPHIFTPSLFKEGLAVYQETDKGLGYGRLDSSYYAMQMRMEADGEGLDDLDEAVLTLDDWPSNKAYLYGGYFMDYLASDYGEDDMSDYLRNYSRRLIPYISQNSTARRSFGRGFNALWDDYKAWTNKQFQPQLAELKAEQVSGQTIEQEPAYRMVMTADDQSLLWVSNNGMDRSCLQRSTYSAAEKEVLSCEKNITDMDMSADGTLAVSRRIPYASGRVLNDIFLWHKDHGWQRLSKQMRLRKVRWVHSNSGEKYLLAGRKVQGISELWWLDLNGRTQLLWQGVAQQVLGGFDVSADGRFVVASIKEPQQGWNLQRAGLPAPMTEADLSWQPLTQTRASENAPVFLPDNRVLFSADYDGVYNLHILDADKGQVEQLTSVVSGAFDPQFVNGAVAYQEYTREGFQLKWLPPQTAAGPRQQPQVVREFAVADYQGRYDYPHFPSADTAAPPLTAAQDYQPWSSLTPQYWFPWFVAEDHSAVAGIMTSGTDALNRHFYSIAAGWDTEQNWGEGQLLYQYDNRWILSWQRSHHFRDLRLDPALAIDDDYAAFREDLLVLQRRYLLHGFEDQLALHAGAVYDNEKLVRLPDELTGSYQYRESLAGLAVTFDNREFYPHVPGIGRGTYFDLVYETNDILDSDFSGAQWQSRWQQTLDLAGRNTLQFTAIAGLADDDTEGFSIGGLSSEEAILFGRDQFSLPGYDSGAQYGRRYYRASLDYQWWLGSVQRNWGLWPLGLGDYYAGIWFSSGSAWNRESSSDALDAVGISLTADIVLGYSAVIPLTLGLARGLDDELGETNAYVRFQFVY
ncbi:MAG: hypothetical protein CMI13_13200 [Oleibacter sp.]|nr:hypothetical protein [Thalassolituus sp.]